jgi:hypothetical protein
MIEYSTTIYRSPSTMSRGRLAGRLGMMKRFDRMTSIWRVSASAIRSLSSVSSQNFFPMSYTTTHPIKVGTKPLWADHSVNKKQYVGYRTTGFATTQTVQAPSLKTQSYQLYQRSISSPHVKSVAYVAGSTWAKSLMVCCDLNEKIYSKTVVSESHYRWKEILHTCEW